MALYLQLMESPVDQKLRECKQLIVQNMERTMQHKIVYMFLKEHTKDGEVKQFSVNSKDGIIKIEFKDHEKALSFYHDYNFIGKILRRPFNIYFNLTLPKSEMKKFYLEGISEENQRQLFEECRKVGVCKLYTSYNSGPYGKLNPNGVLSFLREKVIPEPQFKILRDNLNTLGIKINPYMKENVLNCSINLTNFIEADYNTDEAAIQTEAEQEARRLIKKMTNQPYTSLKIIIKNKEDRMAKKKEGEHKKEGEVVVIARIQYPNVPTTMNAFEQMRDYLVDRGDARAMLYFHNKENNSSLSLFTKGLEKPKDLTEKQFEFRLLKDLRLINKNVIQVNIFPVKYNDSYVGRVYLKTEQDGKEFLVDYPAKRQVLYDNYKDKNMPITFNLSVDVTPLHDPRAKIRNILKDRPDFQNNMDLTTVKRYVQESLKFCLKDTGLRAAEATAIANVILKETNEASTLLDYLEFPEELQLRVQSIKD